MTRRVRTVFLSSLVVTVGAVLGACGGDDLPTVRATITTHRIRLTPSGAAPGRTVIVAENRDRTAHDFHVVRLESPGDAARRHGEGVPDVESLLRDSRGAVFESEIPGEALTGAITRIGPGRTAQISVRLRRGRYVVFCNLVRRAPSGAVVSDFAAGEHAVLRVR